MREGNRRASRAEWAQLRQMRHLIGVAYMDGAITVDDGMALHETASRMIGRGSRGGMFGQRAFNRR